MKATALYYPHTRIRNKALLKNALLLWDHVDCIVPHEGWQDASPIEEPLYREASELVTRNRVPARPERDQAHRHVTDFVRDDAGALFEAVVGSARDPRRRPPDLYRYGPEYLIYPQKFLRNTWHLLEREGLARWDRPTSDWGVPPTLGLMMMSILADACTGSQQTKVTDLAGAYSWIERRRAQALGAEYVTGLDASEVGPNHDRLVTLSLEVLDAKKVPLRRLLRLRRRERRESGHDLRTMRIRYLRTLSTHLDRIANEAKSRADVKELERQFKEELRDDLGDLKKELGLASVRALLSKEIAFSAIAIAGSLAAPGLGLTALATSLKGIGVAPLVKTRADYRAARRKALRSHSMSWLYLSGGPRIPLR